MDVINFFANLFDQFGNLWRYVSTPLSQLNSHITIEPLASSSIMSLLSVGLVGVLGIFLAIHIIRLFVGG